MSEAYTVEAFLRATDKGFSYTMEKAANWLDRISGQGDVTDRVMNKMFGSAGSFAVGSLVARGFERAIGAVSASIGGAVSRVDTMNRFPKMMLSWGYTAEDAEKVISDLSSGIEGLPTKLDDVVQTAQQLTMLNGDLKKSTKLTLALNNAFLSSGSSSMDASRGLIQFSQMMSKGTVDMQSWRTLQETMPVGLQKTAEAFGFTGASAKNDFYAALQSGKITFDQFSDKLIELNEATGGFAEMAKINSVGIATSYTNIQTAISRGVAGVIQEIDKAMKESGFGSIAENLDRVKVKINDLFKLITPHVGDLVRNAGEIGPALGAAFGGLTVLRTASPWVHRLSRGLFDAWNAAENLGGGLKDVAVKVHPLKSLDSWISNADKTLGGKIGGGLQTGYLKALQAADTFKAGVQSRLDALPKWIAKPIQAMGNAMGGGIKKGGSVGLSALDTSLNAMKSIVKLALKTIAPVALVGALLAGMGVLYGQFGGQIDALIQTATQKGPEIIQGLVAGIVSQLPELINTGSQMLIGLLGVISANLPSVIQGGVDIITALVSGVSSNLGGIMSAALDVIASFATSVLSAIPQLVICGMDLLISFTEGILSNSGKIVETVTQIIQSFSENITGNLPTVWNKGMEILSNLVDGIVAVLPAIIPVAGEAIAKFVRTVAENLPTILEKGVEIIGKLISGIAQALPDILTAAGQIIVELIRGIIINLPTIALSGLKIIFELVKGLVTNFPAILQAGAEALWNLVAGILGAIPEALGKIASAIGDFFGGIWDAITGTNEEKVPEAVQPFYDAGDAMQGKASETSINVKARMSELSNSVIENTKTAADEGVDNVTEFATGTSKALEMASNGADISLESLQSSVEQNTALAAQNGGANIAELASVTQSNLSDAAIAAEGSFDSIKTSGDTNFQGVALAASAEMARAKQAVDEALSWIDKTMYRRLNDLVKQTKTQFEQIVTAIRERMQAAQNVAAQTASQMVIIVRGLHAPMHSAGYYAGLGLNSGLIAASWEIFSTAQWIADRTAATIRSALRIHSPSRVMEQLGEYTGEGFNVGMMNQFDAIENTARRMAGFVGGLSVPRSNFLSGISGLGAKSVKPLVLRVVMGGEEFEAFADDISEAQERPIRLRRVYEGV